MAAAVVAEAVLCREGRSIVCGNDGQDLLRNDSAANLAPWRIKAREQTRIMIGPKIPHILNALNKRFVYEMPNKGQRTRFQEHSAVVSLLVSLSREA